MPKVKPILCGHCGEEVGDNFFLDLFNPVRPKIFICQPCANEGR